MHFEWTNKSFIILTKWNFCKQNITYFVNLFNRTFHWMMMTYELINIELHKGTIKLSCIIGISERSRQQLNENENREKTTTTTTTQNASFHWIYLHLLITIIITIISIELIYSFINISISVWWWMIFFVMSLKNWIARIICVAHKYVEISLALYVIPNYWVKSNVFFRRRNYNDEFSSPLLYSLNMNYLFVFSIHWNGFYKTAKKQYALRSKWKE